MSAAVTVGGRLAKRLAPRREFPAVSSSLGRAAPTAILLPGSFGLAPAGLAVGDLPEALYADGASGFFQIVASAPKSIERRLHARCHWNANLHVRAPKAQADSASLARQVAAVCGNVRRVLP